MPAGGDPVARFDRLAAEWDANPGRVAVARSVADAIRRDVPLRRDMDVLDFGAGTGLLSLSLLPDVGQVTAVDASGEMLAVLEAKVRTAKLANVRTLQCDVRSDPLPRAAFDLVVSSMVLHHIPDPAAVLTALVASLRPGGGVAIADLDHEDGSFHTDPQGVFHHGFERSEIRRLAEAAGLTNVCTRDAHVITRPDSEGKPQAYSVFLLTGRHDPSGPPLTRG
ncbi:MAG: hypothetical protein A3K19_01425 [Lentisphaerae bacterium RIFOXYB12_FULL_65_16]|nr:MAG: hypothetical protein A3K18_22780 [Lentisphaerae bacterium RIFOXYA12_64_32]OGV92828.1 MAG: hypothetical protein A3K19_01425 [Lentisphaerae bacterium RIFOXYB12_FULL_65_16]